MREKTEEDEESGLLYGIYGLRETGHDCDWLRTWLIGWIATGNGVWRGEAA